MTHTNPYSLRSTPAAEASITERAAFLQRTYTWLLGGIFGFCGTLWSFDHVEAVRHLGFALFGNPIIAIVVLMGGAYLVHAVAERSPINAVAYALWVFVMGLAIAPLVSYANATAPAVVSQASLITAVVFLGLTIYVFVSGRDFSFLRGALSIGLFALIGIGLASWLIGFDVGIWYSVAGALLFAGYILYDTSQILHRYPTTAHVAAAVVLFTDVVLMFQYILMLLLSSRD